MKRAVWIFLAALAALFSIRAEDHPVAGKYEYHAAHDPDGIGKFYFGREIARVMGHEGAAWLERPERLWEERPDLLIRLLPFHPGSEVADIGSGTGYVTRMLARKIKPGKVFAVDIQPEMIALMKEDLARRHITNVVPVLGAVDDPKLPKGKLDGVVMVDVYHEFSQPDEMLEAIIRSLKPGGLVIFVEYRAEDPYVPIKPLHKMTQAQVKKEAEAHGLVWVRTLEQLPRQRVIIFRKQS